MAYEIIADDKGAIIYNNTDNEPRSDLIKHPRGYNEQAHRNFANRMLERVAQRYERPYTKGEFGEVRMHLLEEERVEP